MVIRCFMPRVPTYLTVPAAKQETLDMLELQIQLFWEVDEVIIIQLRTHLVFWLPLMGSWEPPAGIVTIRAARHVFRPRRPGSAWGVAIYHPRIWPASLAHCRQPAL